MGGGDLNLKKSWGVHIQSNQKKVWEAEQAAIKERKRADVLRKEREEERAVEELRRIAAENGTSASLLDPKIAWMYQDAKAGPGGVAEETEAYLLGKRRVDTLVLKQDKEKTEAVQEANPLGAAFNARDITVKAALDPMFAIEQSRQKALQDAMNDPLMRRKMIKEMSKDKKSKDRDEEKRRKHRHRDDDRHRSKRRRYEIDDDDEDDRRERRRHRRHSTSRSRSRSPYREGRERRSRHSEPSHTASAHSRQGDSTSNERRNRHNRSRSRTPPRREYDDRTSRRERSPYSHDRRSRRDRDNYGDVDRSNRRDHYKREQRSYPSPPDSKQEAEDKAEQAAKLAAMSANANDLEDARVKRLAEMEARDAEAKMKEDQYREKRGDRFVDGLRSKADGQALGDRLRRAGGSMTRLDEAF